MRRLTMVMVLALLPAMAWAETVALTGGTVHTVSGGTIRNGTVLIEGGRITGVGSGLSVPSGATVHDVRGKHVYPGLIAPNTVLGLIEVNSVRGTHDDAETGRINPNVRAEVAINPESELLPVARANGLTTTLIMPRGGAIAGTAALIRLDGWTYEDMTVEAPVGLFVRWPNMTPIRSFFDQRSDEALNKARDEAIRDINDAFHDARAYWKARDAEGERGVPRHDGDVKWDAMGKALRGDIPLLFRADRLSQIEAVLKFVDQEALPKAILVGGNDAWRVADELAAREIPVIVNSVLSLPQRSYESYDDPYTLPAKLYQAGVKFAISDGGSSFMATMARNLPYHAATAAAHGLPREEALRSITLSAAEIIGVADRLGSIEVGKIADLIVADGDPLEITTHVEQVYIAGVPRSMETRHTRLFEKYDARPRTAGERMTSR